jgi:DNA-binding transcriptional LysR family regulator
MTRGEPGWELYRTFLEVVRDGSLSGAARKLALTQPTVGRHIDALEASLELSLFTRSPQGLKATPAALDLVGYAETMAAASAALRRTASGGAKADRGTVRVAASEMIGCEVLPPILTSFRDSHPGITLELALSNRNEDLLRRDADIAVRMVRPRQKSLVARRIGQSAIGFYAHRSYVEKYGLPKEIAELENHCLIGFDRNDLALRNLGELPRPVTRDNFGFRCDSDLAQFAALKAGVGIGVASTTSPGAFRNWCRCWRRHSALISRCGSRCMRTCARQAVSGCCSTTSRRDFRPLSAALAPFNPFQGGEARLAPADRQIST